MNKQTKLMSMVEVMTNIFIGYFVALLTQIIAFPLVGIHIDISTNLLIGAIFTVVAVIRSYAVRRFYEWLRVDFGFDFGRN
jgi:hypothetical protein